MTTHRLLPLVLLSLLALWSCQQVTVLQDFDGDGSLDSDDCQPSNPNVYPGAADSYARAVLMVLADARDELPDGWRATLERL